MAQGELTHPTYLTRQSLIFGKTTAGANTVQFSAATGGNLVFPFDVRLRNMVGSISVAGTSTSPGSSIVLFCPGTSVQYPASKITNSIGTNVAVNGSSATTLTTNTSTTTLGFLPTGTATASSIVQSGDMNVRIPAGQSIILKNGTDATCVVGSVAIEYYIDPVSATWTGPN